MEEVDDDKNETIDSNRETDTETKGQQKKKPKEVNHHETSKAELNKHGDAADLGVNSEKDAV